MEPMIIQSVRGPYRAAFHLTVAEATKTVPRDRPFHCIVDSNVLELYRDRLAGLLRDAKSVLPLEATEDNKSLENLDLVRRLSEQGVKRDHLLVAIGGGIVQDLTCFAASILFRGMDWALLPTTLLAQADSCIGSKSSINAAGVKNLVGTFHAPTLVAIATEFLDTLDPRELRSGIGEMLKVHIIDGPASFDRLAAEYERLHTDRATMLRFVRDSLEIKKALIELDEFDRGPRNVMNYGHSFGHAIEAATDFAVPHGIAVSMGADMANFIAVRLGRMEAAHFDRMHPVLRRNYAGYDNLEIPFGKMMDALARDKKNVGTVLTLILPDQGAKPATVAVPASEDFQGHCRAFLEARRAA